MGTSVEGGWRESSRPELLAVCARERAAWVEHGHSSTWSARASRLSIQRTAIRSLGRQCHVVELERRGFAVVLHHPEEDLNVPTGFLFTQPDGRPWSSSSLNTAWRRVLSGARVRYRPAEQLRHTVASTLLSRGAPLLYVQAVGGWRSAAVLLKVYARWMDTGLGVSGQPAATPAQPRLIAGQLSS